MYWPTLTRLLPLLPLVSAFSQSPLSTSPVNALKVETSSFSLVTNSLHDNFLSFSHPTFPLYGLRVKKIRDFCDSSVNAYAGYLDVLSGGPKVINGPEKSLRRPAALNPYAHF